MLSEVAVPEDWKCLISHDVDALRVILYRAASREAKQRSRTLDVADRAPMSALNVARTGVGGLVQCERGSASGHARPCETAKMCEFNGEPRRRRS